MKKFACLLVALVAISSAKADIIIDSLSRMTFTPIININNEHNPLSGIELQYYNSIQNTILPFRIFQQDNATWLKWVSLPGTIGLRSMSINTNGYVRMGDFGTGNSYSYAYPQMLTIHNQSGVGLHIEQKNANSAIEVYANDTAAFFIRGMAPSWFVNGVQMYNEVFSVDAKGVIRASNSLVSLSDSGHKRNIKSVTNALDGLREVNPVSYILTEKADTETSSQTQSRSMAKSTLANEDDFQPDTVVNADIPAEVRGAMNDEYNRPKYGFIAQELEEIFPNVVYTMSNGEKGIAYQELIPILVSAIQELQAEVESLKSDEPYSPQRQQAPASLQDAIDNNSAVLMQNTPNPFNQATEIGYRLPDGTATAMIMLCDMNGKMLQSYPLATNINNGVLTIQAGSYTPGMYLYTLIVDGVQIDTKQMIILAH